MVIASKKKKLTIHRFILILVPIFKPIFGVVIEYGVIFRFPFGGRRYSIRGLWCRYSVLKLSSVNWLSFW